MSRTGSRIQRTPPKVHCYRCGTIFQKSGNSSKYCSVECRNGTGQCKVCYKVFQKTSFNQTRCKECKTLEQEAIALNKAGWEDIPLLSLEERKIDLPPPNGNCLECGVRTSHGVTMKRKGRFCAPKCGRKYRVRILKQKGICIQCMSRAARPGKIKCAMCGTNNASASRISKIRMKTRELERTSMSYLEARKHKTEELRLNMEHGEDGSQDTANGWDRFDVEYDSSSVYYLSDAYRRAEKVKNLHAIMITQCEIGMKERPKWSTKRMRPLKKALYDKEGEEIVLEAGQVETTWGGDPFSPRELHRMGVKMSRQIKQWRGEV